MVAVVVKAAEDGFVGFGADGGRGGGGGGDNRHLRSITPSFEC
jgi:hypothetical protein